MIYVVSQHYAHDTLHAIPNLVWWAFMEDAKKEAARLANLNARPFYIYSFEQQDCIEPVEPLKTYRLAFERVERDYLEVSGTDLETALKTARTKYPADVWDFYNAEEVKR